MSLVFAFIERIILFMKDFFSEYGKLIIVGALVILVLMFSTPFGQAVTQSISYFTAGFAGKNNASLELVTIGLDGSGGGGSGGGAGGGTITVDGTNITLSNDADGNGVVSKGDTLTFDKAYLYGNAASPSPNQFLVLNTNGSDVELLATTNYQTSKFNTSSVTTNESAGQSVQKYEDSTLDTLLNTTYFNSLSSTVQSKIKSQPITQNKWRWMPNDSGDVDSWYKSGFTAADASGSVYSVSKTGTVGTYNRNVYALDVQDIVEYLGNSFTPQDLNEMFFGTKASVSKTAWLRSAYFGIYDYAFYVNGNNGYLNNNIYNYDCEARPAFTITLN